jgi:hypothetical protein
MMGCFIVHDHPQIKIAQSATNAPFKRARQRVCYYCRIVFEIYSDGFKRATMLFRILFEP